MRVHGYESTAADFAYNFLFSTYEFFIYFKFKCAICLKVMSTKGNLKSHIDLMHSKNHVPFECSLCSQRYNCKRNLKIHLRKHHFGGLDETKKDPNILMRIEKILFKGIFCLDF